MRKIGFTNKFYTLWEITEQETFSTSPYTGKPYVSSVRTYYHFIQNLSFDFERAKTKAGITDYDPTLKGKKSWYTPYKYIPCPIEDMGNDTKIFFGKYSGKTLGEIFVSDRNYFDWLINNTNNPELGIIMNALPLLKNERLNKLAILEESISFSEGEETIEFDIHKNLQPLGNGKYFINIEVEKDYTVKIIFPYAKEQYYAGFEFYLPLDSKGKAKRIKGKTVELSGYFNKVEYNYDNMTRRQEFEVTTFKIIKK